MPHLHQMIGRNSAVLAILVAIAVAFALATGALAGSVGTAYAQDPTETPASASTPEPQSTDTPQPPASTSTPEPLVTDTPLPTYTLQPTYTPLPTEPPQPTYTPLPTPVPQQPAQPYSGTTPFINCGPGEPCIDLHSSHTSISVDDKAQLSLSVTNALNKPNMTVRLLLEIPSGWEVDGEGFAERCSGVCNAVYDVYTAQQELIQITAYPNQTGPYRIAGRIEWRYAGEDNLYHITRDVQVRVTPGTSGNEQRQQPIPAFQAQPYVPQGAPAPVLSAAQQQPAQQQPVPAPQQNTDPGTNGGGGCGLTPEPNGVDPSLLLVAGLILPGIAVRFGWRPGRARNRVDDAAE